MGMSKLDELHSRVAWRSAMSKVALKLRSQGMTQVMIAGMLTELGYECREGGVWDQPKVSRLISGNRINQEQGGS